MELLQTGVGLVLGAAGTVAFYFLKRRFSRTEIHENVDLYTKIAGMTAALREQGISIHDAEQIAATITSKVRIANAVPERREEPQFSENMTQAEMNRHAAASAAAAMARLQGEVARLDGFLSAEEQEISAASQDAWEAYCRQQAQLSSTLAEGGSMQPMLFSSATERLALDRIAFIEEMIKERQAAEGL